jgi:hypothetical protein
MHSMIQSTDAFELSVDITSTAYGQDLRLISRVPIARQQRDHVLFQGTFSRDELTAMRDAIDQALEA